MDVPPALLRTASCCSSASSCCCSCCSVVAFGCNPKSMLCLAWLGLPWLGLAYGVCLIKVQTQPELCACLNNANAKMLLAILVAAVFPFPASCTLFLSPLSPSMLHCCLAKVCKRLMCVSPVCVCLCVCVNCAYGKCCCRVLGADTEPLRPKI